MVLLASLVVTKLHSRSKSAADSRIIGRLRPTGSRAVAVRWAPREPEKPAVARAEISAASLVAKRAGHRLYCSSKRGDPHRPEIAAGLFVKVSARLLIAGIVVAVLMIAILLGASWYFLVDQCASDPTECTSIRSWGRSV